MSIRIFILAVLVTPLALAACASPGDRFELAMDDSDRLLMEQTAQRALEENKIGQSLNWSNPGNQHLGTVMPTRTYKNSSGQDCRQYRESITIDGQTRFKVGARCRQADGAWVISQIPVSVEWPRPPHYRYPYPYYGYPYYPYRPYYGPYGRFSPRRDYWY